MKRTLLGCLLCLALVLPLGAAAQAPAKQDKEGWSAVSRPADMTQEAESVPAGPLVATAYGFIWAAVLVFVGTVAQRNRRLEAEVDALRQRLPGGAR